MGFQIKSVKVSLPFGIGGVTIQVDEAQKQVAWTLYIEIATRIAGAERLPGTGSPREALNSLHSIFETTRTALRQAGSGAASGRESVGPLAIQVLNKGLRKFLDEWHTKLSAFEIAQAQQQRQEFGGGAKVIIDESQWSERDLFFQELEVKRQEMLEYLDALAEIADIN